MANDPIITPPPPQETASAAEAIASLIRAYPDDTDHTSIACGVIGAFSAACEMAEYNDVDQHEAMRMLADCARIHVDHG